MCDHPIWSAIAANKRRETRKTIGRTDNTKPISARSTFRAKSNSGISRVRAPAMKLFIKLIALTLIISALTVHLNLEGNPSLRPWLRNSATRHLLKLDVVFYSEDLKRVCARTYTAKNHTNRSSLNIASGALLSKNDNNANHFHSTREPPTSLDFPRALLV